MEGSKILSELLRDERVAVAAYCAIGQDLREGPDAATLRKIAGEHEEALILIEAQAVDLWEECEESSNVWRAWSLAIQAVAHHLPPSTVLDGLRRGEQQEIDDLKRAMGDDSLPLELRDFIGVRLLPRTVDHLAMLQRLGQRP